MTDEAFLLAGGRGRRLGRDKRFESISGIPLYRHQWSKLSEVFPQSTLLCKKGEGALFSSDAVRVHEEAEPGSALLHGIIEGLTLLEGGCGFFLGVDLPLMPAEGLRFFHAMEAPDHPVIPSIGGRMHFACALYPKTLLPSLEEKRKNGILRLTDVFLALETDLLTQADLPFLKDYPKAFLNLNTLEDLAALDGLAPRS